MQLAAAGRTAAADGFGALSALNNGYLRIYSGAPNDPDSAPSGTLLAECRLNASDAFQAASDDGTNATITANAITGQASATASGTAGSWRVYGSNGTTCYATGTTSGTGGGGELQMNNTSIVQGGQVNIASFAFRMPQGS